MQMTGKVLLDRIGPAILITHSSRDTHGWSWADAQPEPVKAIVAIEPSGSPFQSNIIKDSMVKQYDITDIQLNYDPPVKNDGRPLRVQKHLAANGATYMSPQEPRARLINLLDIPVLFEIGEASTHASYDEFTVKFLREAGVNVEHLKLGEKGIRGNGHLQFLKRNNLETIELLEKWNMVIR